MKITSSVLTRRSPYLEGVPPIQCPMTGAAAPSQYKVPLFLRAGIMRPVRHPVRRQMDELRQMLNEWDFIGVGDISAHDDEYDCLIGPLLTRLTAGATASDLTAYLQHELHDHFGMDLARREVHAFAARTVQWWQQASTITGGS